METRLKLDLSTGTLEVAGEQSFVEKIYEDFKEQLKERSPRDQKAAAFSYPPLTERIPNQKNDTRKLAKKPSAESYQFLDAIDLKGTQLGKSLQDLYTLKSPSTAMEKNTVYIYYLVKNDIGPINMNHIYTCYKATSQRVPGSLRQSLFDTKRYKSWINTSNLNAITLTQLGENLVEHDLPRKGA